MIANLTEEKSFQFVLCRHWWGSVVDFRAFYYFMLTLTEHAPHFKRPVVTYVCNVMTLTVTVLESTRISVTSAIIIVGFTVHVFFFVK